MMLNIATSCILKINYGYLHKLRFQTKVYTFNRYVRTSHASRFRKVTYQLARRIHIRLRGTYMQ